jgi:[ribosomal protein S5]-alanine N-acetyltransferase
VTVTLVTADLALLDAALGDRAALARALDCEIAEGWDVFPRSLRRARDAVAADPQRARWGTRLFVLVDPRTLVGFGGFKGPPRDGVVELGYAIAPAWEGRGLATAAARALLREAFAAAEVQSVVAHTLPAPGPSVRVLEKTGFRRDGEVSDDDVGRVWRFRVDRAASDQPTR